MAVNINPIFVITPKVSWGKLTAANTAKDGTGAVVTIFTAGTNGGRVEKLIIHPLGTNVQTLVRVFINNGADNAVATNNSLIAEIELSATTLAELTAQTPKELPFIDGLILPSGYKINVVLSTAVAAGHQITALGGDF